MSPGSSQPPRRRRWLRRVAAGAFAVGMMVLGAYLVGERSAAEGVTPEPFVWSDGRVRVEVLNLGGVTGMAREATAHLRTSGFDVVYFGNAPSFDAERSSEVVDRVGRTDLARAVATALGIDNVRSEPDPNLYVDVTVLLGRTWIDPDTADGTAGGAERAWWDPRRWIER